MSNRRSNMTDNFATTLSSQVGPTDLIFPVATTSGGPASPCFLVIEPDKPSTQMEIVYFDGSFDGTNFRTANIANRYLSGSAASSGLTHPVGSIVACVPVAAMLVDLHDRVSGHAHTGGDGGAAVDLANLTGHSKAVHDALGITAGDADTVDGQHAAALLSRANHTGTQAVATLSDHNKAVHDALGIVAGSLGGLLGFLSAHKTADEVVSNSITLQNDDHLVVALAANSKYLFLTTLFSEDSGGGGIRGAFTVPTGSTVTYGVADTLSVVTVSGTVVTVGTGIRLMVGYVATGGTAGNLQFRWAQNTAGGTSTMKLGSYLTALKIA